MKRLLIIILLLGGVAYAQHGNTVTTTGAGAPAGSCSPVQVYMDTTNSIYYACKAGTWLQVGPGAAGAAAFDTITTGSNTTATMTCGTGCAMTTAGSGTIAATTATTATNATNIGTAADATNATYSILAVPSTSGNQAAKTIANFTINPSTGAVGLPGTTAIVPKTAAGGDIGSATLPFQYLWFAGTSGTPGTNNFKMIGASTGGTRTITAVDANMVLPQSYSCTNQVATALSGSTGATTCSSLTTAYLPANTRTRTCEFGLGDGANAITAGSSYTGSGCYNDLGGTYTITAIRCFSDNAGTTTTNPTNDAGTALLTGALTCSSSFASGTQSATTTIATSKWIKFPITADGTSKTVTVQVTYTW